MEPGLESKGRRLVGQTIAKLTVDANGKTALDAGFDPKNVVQYGLLINGLSDGFGHEEWANFRRFTRVEVLRRSMVDAVLIYDDPKLIETVQWFADNSLKKGVIVPAKDARQAAATGLFAAQKGALALTGSWLIHWYKENCKFDIGFAPLPKGAIEVDGRLAHSP